MIFEQAWCALLRCLRKWTGVVISSYKKCKKCKHEKTAYTKVVSGKLHEPGEPEREVKLRVRYVECKKCKRILGLAPMGVVYDPKYPEE